jgi:hypothetical protein
MKRNQIISLVLVILLLLLSIGSSGCLLQKIPNQSSTNASITSISSNSPVLSTLVIPTPIPTTPIQTEDPSTQFGVLMFLTPDSICPGDTLTYGLNNSGNALIFFGVGDPYRVQYDVNGLWGDIFSGGGTQGSWLLFPGNIKEWKWKFEGNYGRFNLHQYYNTTDSTADFFVVPGQYRIIFGGTNTETGELFTVVKEFTIRDCRRPVTPLDPSVQSGVAMFLSSDSVCPGQAITYGLNNTGNSTIIFGKGNPYRVQFYENGTWITIFNGGGTEPLWYLQPGNKKEWNSTRDSFIAPGRYRIEFQGEVGRTLDPFSVIREFTVLDCNDKNQTRLE